MQPEEKEKKKDQGKEGNPVRPETRKMEPPRAGWGQTQSPEVRAEEEEESAGRKDQEREFQQVQPETQELKPVQTREN